MNKTELQKEFKIHRKNKTQCKESITNLRKEINTINEEIKEIWFLKEKYNPQSNLRTKIIAIEKRISESVDFVDFSITPVTESSRTQLSKHSKKLESK